MNRYDIALGKKPTEDIIEKIKLKRAEEFNKIITQTPQAPFPNGPNPLYYNYVRYTGGGPLPYSQGRGNHE